MTYFKCIKIGKKVKSIGHASEASIHRLHIINICAVLRGSVMSNSLQPHGLQPTMLLCPWDCPGKNARVGCYFCFHGIFLTLGQNLHLLHLLHWPEYSSPLRHLENPIIYQQFQFHIFPLTKQFHHFFSFLSFQYLLPLFFQSIIVFNSVVLL